MSSEQFERKIRERLSSVNMPPRPELWDRIEAGMAEEKNNQKGGFWWLFSDGLGIILLLLLFFFPFYPSTPIPSSVEQISSSMSSAAPVIPSAGIEVPPTSFPIESVLIGSKGSIAPKNASKLKPRVTPSNGSHLNFSTEQINRSSDDKKALMVAAQPVSRSNERAVQGKDDVSFNQSLEVKSLLNLPMDAETKLTIEDLASTRVISPHSKSINTKGRTFDYRIETLSPKSNELILPKWDHSVTQFPTHFPKKKRLSWLVYFTPEYSFSQLSLKTDTEFLDYDYSQVFNNRNAFTNNGISPLQIAGISFPRWQFTGGIGLEYALTDHWHIQTGLGFSVTERGTYGVETFPLDVYGAPGPNSLAEESLTLTGASIFRTTQLEVPLLLNYHVKKGRDTWILSAGGAFNFTLNDPASKNKSIRYVADNQSPSLQEDNSPLDQIVISNTNGTDVDPLLGLPNFNSYVVGKILYQRSFSPSLSIYTGPSLKYQVSKVFSGYAATDQLPYRIGWEVGIKLSH